MPEAHFELRLPDGNLKLRKDNTVMQFKPSAYMALMNRLGNCLYFQRDCRTPAKLQFFGGGINIGVETPLETSIRETQEESGVLVEKYEFIGQFETYESVHLFLASSWSLPAGNFILQEGEVSEIVKIHKVELLAQQNREKYKKDFYPAQWKMLGWLLLSRYYSQYLQFPVFKLWSEDPWEILDSLR
jgi:8-oxo-dGTP pyrophosphatase MutT (NUDIX family)